MDLAKVEQTSFKILSNLKTLNEFSLLESIIEALPKSSLASHVHYYESAVAFYNTEGAFPDSVFLKDKFEDFEVIEGEVTLDVATGLLHDITNESIQSAASAAIASGDFEEVQKQMSRVCREVVVTETSMEDAIDVYDEMAKQPTGILLGISEIDDVLKGASYGNMGVIASPPSQFKTTTGTSIAYNAAFNLGFNGIYLSFEIMARDVWFNLLSRHSAEMGTKLVAESIKKNLLSEEERKFLDEVKEDWKKNCKGKISVLTPADLPPFSEANLNRLWQKKDEQLDPLDFVIVDYIQLAMSWCPAHMHWRDFLNHLVRYFTELATSFRKPRGLIVILESQINREGERRLQKNQKADLRMFADINNLERDAHWGVVLHSSESMRLNNSVMMQVCKNRSGRVMDEMVNVYVDPTCYLVGSSDFSGIFTSESSSLLEDVEGEESLFE